MPKIPGVSKAARAVTKGKKRSGRKSKRGRPVGTKAEKVEAKKLGITVPELRKRKKKPKKTKKKKTAEPTHTKQERAEIAALARASRRDRDAQRASERATTDVPRGSVPSGGRRLPVMAPGLYPPPASSIAGQSVEAGPLRSKVPPPGTTRADRVSPARKRQLVTSGMAGVGPTGLMTNEGTFAPPAAQTAEAMGIGGKGVLPSKEQLKALGGFQEGRKRGGKVGKKTKRKSSRGVGTGAALRGLGAGRKK